MPWLIYFWILLSAVVFLLHLYFRQVYRFWGKIGVACTSPKFPLGELQSGRPKNLGVLFRDLYNDFVGERFFGAWLFWNPILLIRDPELIKTIFVRDFISFHNRGIYHDEKGDPLSAHLFVMEGLKWKNIRAKLSPTFTSGKMKMMFPVVVNCSEELKAFLREPAEKREVVDIKEVMARFMTDVISLCAFGINTNSMKNPKAMFRKMGKKAVEPSLRNMIVFNIQFLAPKLAKIIKLRIIPKDVSNYFLEALRDVMGYREKNNVVRNDFLQLLIQIKNEGIVKNSENEKALEVGEKLTFEEAAAEAFVFFIAGFETSSATVQFALYELARNPDVQEKLRNEILKSLEKHNNKMTYEGVHDITYLDKVIDETLRKYPVVPSLVRECNRNYQIPESNVVIPKGTLVHIPIYGIQMDPKYFPNPEKFDPERFSEDEKQKRHNYTYLPFGEGPRNCIGKRFGLMQVRIAIIAVLQNYKVGLSEDSKETIEFDEKAFVLLPKKGINLKISPLQPY